MAESACSGFRGFLGSHSKRPGPVKDWAFLIIECGHGLLGYILQSKNTGRYYCGHTDDFTRRVSQLVMAKPNNAQTGHWCPYCAWEKNSRKWALTIDEMHKIAENRGGRSFSAEYINQSTKLLWECGDCGTQWSATPKNIKNGRWRPTCGRKRKRGSLK